MIPSRRRLFRPAASVLGLFLVAAVALWGPVPHLGDQRLAHVLSVVHQRLPGWSIDHAADIWEGGYSVVARCGTSHLGFHVVPGHGLPPGDAWLQPNDAFTEARLHSVSDFSPYLVWLDSPAPTATLSCRDELARVAAEARADRSDRSAGSATDQASDARRGD
jgi:hypothetical protein